VPANRLPSNPTQSHITINVWNNKDLSNVDEADKRAYVLNRINTSYIDVDM
jgi:hypothetical protein